MVTQFPLSVILPVYNQADHIQGIVEAYLAAVGQLRVEFELLLVVNGSKDNSLELCHAAAAGRSNIRVFCEEQSGWGRAVRRGLREARGQLLCYTNSARTTPYHLAMLLLIARENPTYIVKANRRLRYPLLRRLGSGLYNLECRALFDLAVWDVNGTPKIIPRDLVPALDLKQDGDLIDLELVVRASQLGFQIIEVPIVSEARHGGRSTTRLRSAMRMYWGAVALWRQLRAESAARAPRL